MGDNRRTRTERSEENNKVAPQPRHEAACLPFSRPKAVWPGFGKGAQLPSWGSGGEAPHTDKCRSRRREGGTEVACYRSTDRPTERRHLSVRTQIVARGDRDWRAWNLGEAQWKARRSREPRFTAVWGALKVKFGKLIWSSEHIITVI